MTGRQLPGSEGIPPPGAEGWRAAAPELVIAATLVALTSIIVYLYAGLGAAVVAVIIWAGLALVALRWIVPPAAQLLVQQVPWLGAGRTSFTGYWRKRVMLTDASASIVSYDAELRPTLQHLLAARLAERHGVSLYADPEAARRLLLPREKDDVLWFWLDPRRPADTDQQRRGIPQRTLAAIIDRLERL